ncbi:hypothetical protein BU24DRAFT_339509 [Aaosphaeria arxii CBS 175.79]|uniref:Homeobox domain-containing protein n=1 Tax=Aaosphaeria arxii CBS 175.79 TaxID=1450172 RepID=A0A6A5Y605_9PLEO|nr:uncharacterized protein BU24DRAFT_339509 [Aaosphaeria arxii CBS 175.79]KAF2020729.1 hypothetical protein BU24DRAFT_339509 [Aaosphaeria arxii CBS 175.79]
MATPNVSSEMAQFFDFGEAAMPDTIQDVFFDFIHTLQLPAALLTDLSCLCHESQDVQTSQDLIAGTASDAAVPSGPEWNSDFSSWIPTYSKPADPCDYCRSRSLECFIYNTGGGVQSACSPCNALFRPCSFSEPEKMVMQNKRTAIDTLASLPEDIARNFGTLTGRKPLRSLGHVGPIEEFVDPDSDKTKRGASAARFPRGAVKVLKEWMNQHRDHPYPTEEEKETLGLLTGLSMNQISNWMANTRRRQKNRPKRSASPSIRPNTQPMNIPDGRTWDEMNPFERWKHSPPENEPAPLTAIAKAVETFDPPQPDSLSSSYNGRSRKGNSSGSTGSFSLFKAPSTTSLETGFTNMSSGSLQSHGTAWSHGSRNSFGSLTSLNSQKERRRRRKMPTRTPKLDLSAAPRPFQCTFCTDTFKNKYDWSRHEKSLHLSLEKWICAPIGEVIICTASGQRKCVYCDAIEPSKEHLETHHYHECAEKGLEARTFYRKDHLRQHLRLMHGCKMTSSMESWKAEAQYINSRCGFCDKSFDKWQDRVDHLAKEFRNGANMKNWKGCRGLDPSVAAQVTNAMPPYLIADESKSPFPFSAGNTQSLKHHNTCLQQDDFQFLLPSDSASTRVDNLGDRYTDGSASLSPLAVPTNTPQHQLSSSKSPSPHPNATCWEILTLRLGQFARQYLETHEPSSLTDEMLQQQARFILYDSDDPWNQTSADNAEWLALFKKSHGIPSSSTFTNWSSHEVLEDLGIRQDTKLDTSFNLSNFTNIAHDTSQADESLVYECLLAGTLNNSKNAQSMFRSGTPLTLPELASSTTSGASNYPLTSNFELQGLDAPISELGCTVPGGPCIGENGEIGYAVSSASNSRRSQDLSLGNPGFLAPIQEKKCTKSGDPIFPPIQERACAKSGDAVFPTLQEMPCTTTGEPLPSHFDMIDWDQQFATSARISTSPSAGKSSGSSPDVIEGTMGQPQVLRWGDHPLDAGLMDMDLDLDIDLSSVTVNDNNNGLY